MASAGRADHLPGARCRRRRRRSGSPSRTGRGGGLPADLRLAVSAADLADLADPVVLAELGLADKPTWFLDRDLARRVASRVRRESPARGLVVPSAAFVDDPSRANLVLFMDGREDRIGELIRGHAGIGEIRLNGG